MASSIFQKLEQQAFRAGVAPRTEESRKWFMQKLKNMRVNRRNTLSSEELTKVTRPRIGNMYMYFYDPKTKETLPYYDRFPLVIMVEPAKGGFYGINLHYLSPILRARLFDKLLETTNNNKYDESTKMKIRWELLKSVSRFPGVLPCYKRYLYSQIQQVPVKVSAPEWEIAVFLPTEQFVKSSKRVVWSDSKKNLRG